jgi:hypothetical protein
MRGIRGLVDREDQPATSARTPLCRDLRSQNWATNRCHSARHSALTPGVNARTDCGQASRFLKWRTNLRTARHHC